MDIKKKLDDDDFKKYYEKNDEFKKMIKSGIEIEPICIDILLNQIIN